jgi:hypothetical protein
MMNKLIIIACLVVTLTIGSIAFGSITEVVWKFEEPDLTPLPDIVSNPYGDPALQIVSCYWIDVIDGRTGVFPLSGQMDVYLPNSQTTGPNTYKDITLTLIWKASPIDTILPNDPLVAVTPYVDIISSREDIDLGNGWIQTLFAITIWPNPTEEWFTIKGDIMVDELSIYTECVPEPATICLLGLGTLTILRKRRV